MAGNKKRKGVEKTPEPKRRSNRPGLRSQTNVGSTADATKVSTKSSVRVVQSPTTSTPNALPGPVTSTLPVANPPPASVASSSVSQTRFSLDTKYCPITLKPPPEPEDYFKRPNLNDFLAPIKIYHPAVDRAILEFSRPDSGGVHYNVAYYAACIVAGNIWKEDEGRNERDLRRSVPPSDPDVSPTVGRARRERGRPRKERSRNSETSRQARIMKDIHDTTIWATQAHARPFFSTSDDPSDLDSIVICPPDEILRESSYFFHFCEHPDHVRYPIVTRFDDWIFPHGNVPFPWSSQHVPSWCDLEDSKLAESLYCRFTAQFTKTESAHMIPKKEHLWFDTNSMYSYTDVRNGNEINATSNTFSLRADVRKMFDNHFITIVPKPNRANERTYSLCIHFLHTDSDSFVRSALEIIDLWQNQLIRPIPWIHPNFIFGRFAWSIFHPAIMPILSQKVNVLVYESYGYPLAYQTTSQNLGSSEKDSANAGSKNSLTNDTPTEGSVPMYGLETASGTLAGFDLNCPEDFRNPRLGCLYDSWPDDDEEPNRRGRSLKR